MRDAIGDTLLLLEHPHVFTLGRGADERFLLNPPGRLFPSIASRAAARSPIMARANWSAIRFSSLTAPSAT